MSRLWENPKGEIWVTDERPTRILIVRGRSGIDPDCLVAYSEEGEGPLWIVDDAGRTTGAFVCGLKGKSDIHAMLVSMARAPLSQDN